MSKGGGQTPAGDYLMSQLPANYRHAQSIAATPFVPFTGKFAPDVPHAINNAISTAQNVAGYQPQQVSAPTIRAPMAQAAVSGVYGVPTAAPAAAQGSARAGRRGTVPAAPRPAPAPAPMSSGPTVSAMQGVQGLDAYMNPYLGQVADRTLADLDRFRQMATNQNASNASLAGAFGGDRLGVENALTNEGFAKSAADSLASLYAGGFDRSAGLLMGDKDRLLQNQQFNAGLAQQSNLANQQARVSTNLANQQVGLQGQIANQQAGLDAGRLSLGAAQTLGNLGGLQYGMESDPLQMAYQEFLRQQQDPYQKQALLNSALGLIGQSMAGQYNEPSYPLPGLVGGMTSLFKPVDLAKSGKSIFG